MRVVEIAKHGKPGVMRVAERPDPELGEGQVRIDVAACGVNFADVVARLGFYREAPKPPCVVGYEVAGTVAELGEGVQGFEPGARVVAATQFGGYASQVCVPAADVVALPERLSFEQGAAIPVNYATAWAAVVRYGNLRPGEIVMIQSAGGGVGIAATQIARRQGAGIIYGTASKHKHRRVRDAGVDHVYDYGLRELRQGLPDYDLILDPLGGRSQRLSYKMLGPGGRLVAYGASNVVAGNRRKPLAALATVAMTPRFSLLRQMSESKIVIGLNMLALWRSRGSLAPWIEPLRELLDDGTIDPVVDEVFPFQRAAAAHERLTRRENVGKVVLRP